MGANLKDVIIIFFNFPVDFAIKKLIELSLVVRTVDIIRNY